MQKSISRRTLVNTGILGGTAAALGITAQHITSVAFAEEQEHEEKPHLEDLQTDVAVIGGGLAGLVASLVAAQAGARVVLAEKLGFVGGSGILTSAGIYAVETDVVPPEIETKDEMYDHIIEMIEDEGTTDHVNLDRIRHLVDECSDVIAWLEGMGYVFAAQDYLIKDAKPHYHYLADESGGAGQVAILEKAATEAGVQILTDTTCTSLLFEDGSVRGLSVEQKEGVFDIKAQAVVIACGGYGRNDEMIMRLNPQQLFSYTCTNAGATGEVLQMAADLGAAWDHEQYMITCGYTSDPENPALANILYAAAMPLVDQTGCRIVDESLLWALNSRMTRDIENAPFYAIFDNAVAETADAVKEAIENGSHWVVSANTLDELARKMNIRDVDAFLASIEGYNEAEQTGEIDEFGLDPSRKAYVKEAPFYGVLVVSLNAGTSGGIQSKITTEVLDRSGEAIPGLFVAGEASNGDLYDRGYISGTSVLNCYVAGRDAGNAAAKFAGK